MDTDSNPDTEGRTDQKLEEVMPIDHLGHAGSSEPEVHAVEWFKEHSIPLVGLVLIALVLCLIGHYSSVTIDWMRTKDFTDAFRNVTQGLAFIAGGIWAYFKFVKGRTFKESLVPAVFGKLVKVDDAKYLIVTTQIKNVGLSKIEIDHRSSLIVFKYNRSPGSDIFTVSDEQLAVFDVFDKNERYIEPNEIIEGQRIISMPNPLSIAYRLEVEIASQAGFSWRANSIVAKSLLDGRIEPAELATIIQE